MRKNDKEILQHLLDNHIDREKHGLGYIYMSFDQNPSLMISSPRLTSFRKMRKQMNLERSRTQNHTLESIREAMQGLRMRFPVAGAREMTSLLFHERDMSVPR